MDNKSECEMVEFINIEFCIKQVTIQKIKSF